MLSLLHKINSQQIRVFSHNGPFLAGLLLAVSALACSLPSLLRGRDTPTPTQTFSAPASPAPSLIPTATPRPLPPDLIEVDPPAGSVVPLNASFTFFFNQPLEHSSVEAAFAGPRGTIEWIDDATFRFISADELQPDQEITFSLGDQARSAAGIRLPAPLQIAFRTGEYLRLTQHLPEAGADQVDPSAAILATFNQPVVPLGADPDSLPEAFSLEPPADGEGKWLNTSSYIFYPRPALAGGRDYTVRLRENLLSTNGSPLEIQEFWSFTTAKPQVLSVVPEDGQRGVPLDASVELTFNQPMDPQSVATSAALRDQEGEEIPGNLSWNEGATQFIFKASRMLRRDRLYTFTLGANVLSAGGTTLGAEKRYVFRTVPELTVEYSVPDQGGEKNVYSSIEIHFNAPVKFKDILQFITIEPEVADLQAFTDSDDRVLWLNGRFSPRTNYTLILSPNLPDRWNGRLGREYVLDFSTAPLHPALFVSFTSDILFARPAESSVIAQVTNLSQLSVTLGRVPVQDFLALIGPQGYELRQGYRPVDEETHLQPLNIPPDKSTPVRIPLTLNGAPLAPGLYFLRFNVEQEFLYGGPFLLVVSDINTTFKLSATDTLVWVVDLQDGSPIEGAPVKIYDEDGRLLSEGRTGEDGVFKAEVPQREKVYSQVSVILGEPGDEHFSAALTSWNRGLTGGSFGYRIDYSPPHLEAYFYTDRPIYRPGQTVYFRAVLRQVYNGRYSLPDRDQLHLEVVNDLGVSIAKFDLPLSDLGTGHGSYDLPLDIQPGVYRLLSEDAGFSSVSFQVAEYRKPEIDLQVNFSQEEILAGESLQAKITARYFFDAPAGDVPVTWTLFRRAEDFFLPGYQFGKVLTPWLLPFPEAIQPGLGELLAQGEGKTNARGEYVFEAETLEADSRYRYTLEVTATDESGLPVNARAEIIVDPARIYIGIRPGAWFARAGSEAAFEIMVADWDGHPAGAQSLGAEFKKVVWKVAESQPDMPGDFVKFIPEYSTIGVSEFTTNADGIARLVFTPPEPGTYQLDVSGKDPGDSGALTQVLLWVGGEGEAVWPHLPNQRLHLTADKDSYAPGDTAQVFVPNPFGAGVRALVTVERGIIFRYQVLEEGEVGFNLSIPLTDEDAPNVYVSVTLLKANAGIVDFRQGYISLPVSPVTQELHVELTGQPERTQPRQEVILDLRVTDSNGEPVQGEFSLAVVDRAVLALAEPNSEDILPAFYSEQPLGVNTSLSLAGSTQLPALAPLGQGGGGGEPLPTIQIREEFPDTAYWNAEILTDEDGRARVEVTLPDSLTTWQVETRGVTADTRVGQARTQVITTKELLVRPVTPRFLVLGDHALVSAVVQNNTNAHLVVDVSLAASGFLLDDSTNASHRVTIAGGDRAHVEWWGTAQNVEQIDLIFSARATDALGNLWQDVTRPAMGTLPVLRYVAPQTFGTTGILDSAGELLESVSLPRSFDPQGGQLEVEVAPTLGSAILRALDVLEIYPYPTTDQLISRFLPTLEIYRVMQEFDLDEPGLRSRLDRILDDSRSQLAERQNDDGGWGWWQDSRSDPLISAYVILGLSQAREAGIAFDSEIIENGAEYLRAALPTVDMLEESWQLDRLSFLHYALAEADQVDAAGVSQLFEARHRLNPWAQAILALTLDQLDPQDERARQLFSDLESSASRSATGAHWENREPGWQNMSSPIQATAVVLYALAKHDPASPLVADGLRYLMTHREASGAWPSTYETAWTIMAAAQVMRGTGELRGDFDFSVSLNGRPLLAGKASPATDVSPVSAEVPLNDLYRNDPNVLMIERGSGSGRLYYRTHLRLNQPVEQVSPLSSGLNLSRVYYPALPECPGETCPSLESARQGELVTVHLTLTVPETAYYLVVEDYFPAGAEVLDTSLKTSQLGAVPQYDPRDPLEDGWGWWWFSSPRVYDDHIAWTAEQLPAGTYELTYQLILLQPGDYHGLPARAWQAYFPEVHANSAGVVFEILK